MVQAKCFAWGIQKSHLKSLKIICFWVIVYVFLNLVTGWPSLKKVCGTVRKWKFFFCVLYAVWTLSNPRMKFCFFSISAQFNFKNGHFFTSRWNSTMRSCCFHWTISKPKSIFSTKSKAPVSKIYHNIHFSCCYS